MYNFILQIAIMLSLGTMIYLMARAVPRIGDETSEIIIKPKSKFDQLVSSLPMEKIDAFFNNFIEKLLRKLKLLSIKLDNFSTNYLNKVKKYKLNNNLQKNNGEKPSLFDKKKEEESNISSK
jgi:hypothetical protein